jgi:Asp-tRNA(Asn)/Glu-tRNA(Gln) amidotransferase A subunit family amidase
MLFKGQTAAQPPVSADLGKTVQALAAGVTSVRSYCAACLERIRATESKLHAWAALDDARALALAAARDAERARSRPPGALFGIPVGVKDIFDTDDLPTEMGSPAFVGNQPRRNAELVRRMIGAGAYAIGKTATTEFAFLHPAETRNPWNRAHTPGGSSSGSAVAVAAGHVPVAVGTQTNGSVIRPAAFCGIVGFKPTLDVLPVQGTFTFSETLDQAGVLARKVADAAYFASCLAVPGMLPAALDPPPKPPKVAFLPRFPWNAAEPGAAAQMNSTLDLLTRHGMQLAEAALPDVFEDAHRVHRTIMLYEGARNHSQRQVEFGRIMSRALNEAIDQGLAISSENYRKALSERAALIDRARELFDDCEAILSLPAPGTAPARLDTTGDPSFCTLWSLVGFPAVTLPTGLSEIGLPHGMQLGGCAGEDSRLLRVALWCETVIGFNASPS